MYQAFPLSPACNRAIEHLEHRSRKVIAIVPVGSDPVHTRDADDQYALILNRNRETGDLERSGDYKKKNTRRRRSTVIQLVPAVSAAVRQSNVSVRFQLRPAVWGCFSSALTIRRRLSAASVVANGEVGRRSAGA
jgi:hypothetical protein